MYPHVHICRADQADTRGRENLPEAPKYLEKIKKIIEVEGGILEDVYAIMGPWDFVALVKYPDNETAFRVLAKIGMLEVVKTETFPAERSTSSSRRSSRVQRVCRSQGADAPCDRLLRCRLRPARPCQDVDVPCSCCTSESLDIFGEKGARRELRRYLRKGLGGADARLIAAWAAEGELEGATVIEVGGGIGQIQVDLLRRGAMRGTVVEVLGDYRGPAGELAAAAGVADRSSFVLADLI